MRFCTAHWTELKDAIEARGLWHLVSVSGQDAVVEAIKNSKGQKVIEDFDPLLAAHHIICGNSIQVCGTYLMIADVCPCCEVVKLFPNDPRASSFIGLAADGVKEYWDSQHVLLH